MAPAIPVAALVNFNVFSHPALEPTFRAGISTRRSLLGESLDYSDTEDPNVAGIKVRNDTQEYKPQPASVHFLLTHKRSFVSFPMILVGHRSFH